VSERKGGEKKPPEEQAYFFFLKRGVGWGEWLQKMGE